VIEEGVYSGNQGREAKDGRGLLEKGRTKSFEDPAEATNLR